MNERAHIKTTRLAIQIANQVFGQCCDKNGEKLLAAASGDTDHIRDVEFVKMKGAPDDPHRWEIFKRNDKAHYLFWDINLTAFNHYIDIKKGPGEFDDYDGYSYGRGSAQTDQYQPAEQLTKNPASRLTAKVLGRKVDEIISYGFSGEYVHAYGQKWYHDCSPALMNYSYPRDQAKYPSKRAELKARFPVAKKPGQENSGFPSSVFMPVDNLGRYWFDQFVRNQNADLNYLGPVMHAIQDASIPHHAAGYAGNWHVAYERQLDEYVRTAYSSAAFKRRVKALVQSWQRNHDAADADVPSLQWPVQRLITWVAEQAYQAYAETYHHFKHGYKVNQRSMEKLCCLAAGMSALVLHKAIRAAG